MHPFNPNNSRATALARAICGAALFSAYMAGIAGICLIMGA